MAQRRRRFTKRQRDAIFLAADGRSELSGAPLDDTWHADHIVPWSRGGITDVTNAQALTPEENMRKGTSEPVRLRKWQREFLEKYQQHEGRDFTLAGLPACGKTVAAVKALVAFLQMDPSRRVIVVVPTLPVREQWRGVAHQFGVLLQTYDFHGTFRPGFDGAVVTYAAVANNPDLYRRLCAKRVCFVLFDEIHHAGDRLTWGRAIQYAFENAHQRLAMTGTPFRHDTALIPFLRVGSDGFYVTDFRYDYPEALKDGIVREIVFHRYAGSVTIAHGEDVIELHTDEDLHDDDASRRLRGLLSSPAYVRSFLTEAHDRLVQLRKAKPDAGALALCIDANHAVRVSQLLADITGAPPDVVLSDDERATSSVRSYRESRRPWIVAVRMVSEGVDIKRLMTLAYLTNATTELFFRQAVGRIMRYEGTEADIEAYCYMPDDARLSAHAAKIEHFQQVVIKEEEEEEAARSRAGETGVRERSFHVLESSEASFAGVTMRGTPHDLTRSERILELSKQFGFTEVRAAEILDFVQHHPSGPATAEAAADPGEHPEDEIRRARRRCSKLANRAAERLGVEPKEIHTEYLCRVGVRQADMTLAQLEEKERWLLSRLNHEA